MSVTAILSRIRDTLDSNAYAGTFQTLGQYRTALCKHIDNLTLAARAAGTLPPMEKAMTAANEMPLVAEVYPSEHPFPAALRRVRQLELALASGLVVQLDALTTYTITSNGGMAQDKRGPWVMKVDVMGHASNVSDDTEELALFSAKMHYRLEKARQGGRYGWNSDTCSVDSLARLLMLNVASGDHVSVANYAMMLEQRGAGSDVLPKALTYFARQEAVPLKCPHDSADTFAQALIAQGWHNPDPDCVGGLQRILGAFLTVRANEVPA